MSKFNDIFPRRDDPVDRCHILFHQLHSLLTILTLLTDSDNSMGWGKNENDLFFLLQQMVAELAHNYSRHLDDIAGEARGDG